MAVTSKQFNSKLVLKKPRITEKASLQAGFSAPVYTFEIGAEANKREVATAIKQQYGVTPVKVNVVSLPSKRVIRRGRRGVKSGVKKALVFLKAGDKIDLA